MIRSILSVIVGYLAISILVVGTLFILEKTVPEQFGMGVTVFPETKWVSLVLTLGFFYAMIGGYITSLIARRDELAHVVALSTLMIVLSIISFRYESVPQPLWYKFGVVFSGVAGVFMGLYIYSIVREIRNDNFTKY